MLNKYSILVLIASGLVLSCFTESCNPPETIPCYGHIDSINVNTTYFNQGTASSNVTCAWVYIDDQPVGAFDLPCTFPMIAGTGTHTITIYPGITADGASFTREKYQFYSFYDSSVNVTQGAITKFSFTAHYKSNVQFVWMEDFESPGTYLTQVNIGTDTNALYRVGRPTAFEGNYSGQVLLDSTKIGDTIMHWEAYTDTMSLPIDGSTVFMELNYNTNNVFGMGIVPCTSGYNFYGNYGTDFQPYVYINPSNGAWKKMYIDMTSALRPIGATHFILFFDMWRQRGIQARLLFDNIKVLHFKGA